LPRHFANGFALDDVLVENLEVFLTDAILDAFPRYFEQVRTPFFFPEGIERRCGGISAAHRRWNLG